jgi:hypothetical protein
MSEWSQGLTQKMWTEVSSSVPHFLVVGLLLIPITYKCLLKVLCQVRRPITTLDCVLLKDNNRVLVASLGPEINSRSCLYVLQGPRHNTKCWSPIQRSNFLLVFCLETPKESSGPANLWTEPPLASLSVISFPRSPARPGIQYSPTVCRAETSFSYEGQCVYCHSKSWTTAAQ